MAKYFKYLIEIWELKIQVSFKLKNTHQRDLLKIQFPQLSM